jgi:hypothetical protein
VRASTISGAGNGLFASTSLEAGERLEVVGVLVPAGSPSDVCTHYADCYKFRVGDLLLIPLGHAALVNHSTSPNLEKVIDGQTLYLRTTRAIASGEELFLEYAPEFFKVTKIDPASLISQAAICPPAGGV